jgi:hypothetical protein
MGLKWVLATLGLNTLGALAYAIKVGFYFYVLIIIFWRSTDSLSSSLKGGLERPLTFLGRVINGYMLWSYSRVWLILLGS